MRYRFVPPERGSEMPPHPRMAHAQALLARALGACCWAGPYVASLVRCGTELHDWLLLHWYEAADIAEVADDLARHGAGSGMACLVPFLEFCSPRTHASQPGGLASRGPGRQSPDYPGTLDLRHSPVLPEYPLPSVG